MSGERGQTREFIEQAVSGSGAFLVDTADGTEVGVVDEVVLDHAGRPVRVEVTCGWFGRRRCSFDIDDIVAAYPLERLLVVLSSAAARGQDPQP
jgi:hypothetical protein